jgi:hypothetical protein
MSLFLQIMIIVAIVSVVGALFFGLRNMMKGGSPLTSNKLMQLRIFLQFIAVVLIVVALYFGRPA